MPCAYYLVIDGAPRGSGVVAEVFERTGRPSGYGCAEDANWAVFHSSSAVVQTVANKELTRASLGMPRSHGKVGPRRRTPGREHAEQWGDLRGSAGTSPQTRDVAEGY